MKDKFSIEIEVGIAQFYNTLKTKSLDEISYQP